MKNRKRKIIGGLLINMLIMAVFIPLPVKAQQIGNETVNIVLRKQEGTDNQVYVSLETTNTKSIASFQLELETNTEEPQDITNVTIEWDNAINQQAELKEITYNNGKINLYAVSKNELGEQDTHQRRIEIGKLTIETQEKDNIDVTLKANKGTVKLASINHERTSLTNEPTQMALRINENTTNEGGNEGGNQGGDQTENGSGEGTDNPGGGDNQGGNAGQGNGNNGNHENENIPPQEGDQEENEIQDEIEEGNTLLNQNTTITTSSKPLDKKATGNLPQTGGINGLIIFILLAIIILIAIVMYRKWKKTKY